MEHLSVVVLLLVAAGLQGKKQSMEYRMVGNFRKELILAFFASYSFARKLEIFVAHAFTASESCFSPALYSSSPNSSRSLPASVPLTTNDQANREL